MHGRRPVRRAERIYHQIGRHQDSQAHWDKQASRVRARDQQVRDTHRVDGQRDQVALWGSIKGLELLRRMMTWSLHARTWLSLRFPGPSSIVSGQALRLIGGSDALFALQFLDGKHGIVQWNCRGLGPRYEELVWLLTLLGPSVFCLREACLKAEDGFTSKGFNACSRIHSDCLRASGGSSVFVLALSAKLDFVVVPFCYFFLLYVFLLRFSYYVSDIL